MLMRGLARRVAALAATGLLATGLTALATTPAAAAAGDTDTTFSSNIGTGLNAAVSAVTVQSDGKAIVGGGFTSVNGTTSNYIARLNADGTPDTIFSSNMGTGLNAPVYSVDLQSDGKIVLGGEFTSLNGTTSNYIARLNTNGTPDTSFSSNIGTGFNAPVYSLAVHESDGLIAGGRFTSIDGTTSNRIARLNANGTPDTTFSSNIGTGFNDDVYRAAVTSTGHIIAGGDFSTLNDVTSNHLARLNADGTPDTTFNSNTGTGFSNGVFALTVQSDGKTVVGGSFNSLNGADSTRIARLNSDGTPDTSFSTNTGTGFSNAVYSLAMQSDGKIIVGGRFASINGTASNGIARLNSDGTPDTAYTDAIGSGFSSHVETVVALDAGRVLVGGDFTSINGTTSNRIARLLGPTTPTPPAPPGPTPTVPPTTTTPPAPTTPAPTTSPTPAMQPPAAPQPAKKSLTKLKRKLAKGKAGAKSLRLKLRLSGDLDARASELQWRFKVKANKSQRAKKKWSAWKSLAVSTQASKAKLKVGKAKKVRKSLTGRASDNAAVKLQIRAANDAGVSKATSVRLRPSKG
jgi:uncharacterized delta-60 repeat protein